MHVTCLIYYFKELNEMHPIGILTNKNPSCGLLVEAYSCIRKLLPMSMVNFLVLEIVCNVAKAWVNIGGLLGYDFCL